MHFLFLFYICSLLLSPFSTGIKIHSLWIEEASLDSNSLPFNVVAFIIQQKWNFFVHLEHYFYLRGDVLIYWGKEENNHVYEERALTVNTKSNDQRFGICTVGDNPSYFYSASSLPPYKLNHQDLPLCKLSYSLLISVAVAIN